MKPKPPTSIQVSRAIIGAYKTNHHNDLKHHRLLLDHTRKTLSLHLHTHDGHRILQNDYHAVHATLARTPKNAEYDKLTLHHERPPRILKPDDHPAADDEQPLHLYTTDFTHGEASRVSRHTLLVAAGAMHAVLDELARAGLRVSVEGAATAELRGGAGRAAEALSRMRQPPTASPRLDAIVLNEQMDREMRERQARFNGVCHVRADVYRRGFDELIDTLGRAEPKRGELLRCVCDEARLSTDAYRTVYEESLGFGRRKLERAPLTVESAQEQVAAVDRELLQLRREVRRLGLLCESLEHRASARAKASGAKSAEVAALEVEQRQLRALLEALKPVQQWHEREAALVESSKQR